MIRYEAFEFYLPVSITPQDTIVVGDTLWMEMDITNQLIDHQTGEEVNLSNFELVLEFGVSKVDSTSMITGIGHLGSFEVIEELRQQVYVVARHSIYMHAQADKRCRVGLITQKIGTYSISLAISSHYMEIDGTIGLSTRNCYEDLIEYTRVLVNNGQTNFHLAKGVCRYNSQGAHLCYGNKNAPEGRYNGYYFHVKAP